MKTRRKLLIIINGGLGLIILTIICYFVVFKNNWSFIHQNPKVFTSTEIGIDQDKLEISLPEDTQFYIEEPSDADVGPGELLLRNDDILISISEIFEPFGYLAQAGQVQNLTMNTEFFYSTPIAYENPVEGKYGLGVYFSNKGSSDPSVCESGVVLENSSDEILTQIRGSQAPCLADVVILPDLKQGPYIEVECLMQRKEDLESCLQVVSKLSIKNK
jgi:hypothetical protein